MHIPKANHFFVVGTRKKVWRNLFDVLYTVFISESELVVGSVFWVISACYVLCFNFIGFIEGTLGHLPRFFTLAPSSISGGNAPNCCCCCRNPKF